MENRFAKEKDVKKRTPKTKWNEEQFLCSTTFVCILFYFLLLLLRIDCLTFLRWKHLRSSMHSASANENEWKRFWWKAKIEKTEIFFPFFFMKWQKKYLRSKWIAISSSNSMRENEKDLFRYVSTYSTFNLSNCRMDTMKKETEKTKGTNNSFNNNKHFWMNFINFFW